MSVISAGTTSTTAFKVTSDTTGTLQLKTGAASTTAIDISASQVVSFPATTTLDFTGNLLLGDGSATAPTLAHSGDTNTGIYFPGADQIAITTAGSQKLFVGTSFVVNEGGLDFDTRIEGDTDANLVFVDASADAVGIGTNTPGGKFNIVKAKSGTGAESYDMLRLNLTGTAAIGDSSDIVWYNGSTKVASINGILGADNALYGTLTFSTRSYNTDTLVEAVRINNRSNVGIGTTNPSLRVDVQKSDGSGRQDLLRVLAGGNATDNGASIALGSTQTQCGYITGLQTASNEGVLVFGTQSSGAYAERARITSDGQIITAYDGGKYTQRGIVLLGSAFNNPVQSIITLPASGSTNSVISIKVTCNQNAYATAAANQHIGNARAMWDGSAWVKEVDTMTVVCGDIATVGTLAWSGSTLQYTTNRVSNYDGYLVTYEVLYNPTGTTLTYAF